MKEGHFENGRWVENDVESHETGAQEAEAEADTGGTDDFDEKINQLRSSVSRNFCEIFGLGKDLLLTERGRKHLSKKIKKSEEKIDRTIRDLAEEFESAMKK